MNEAPKEFQKECSFTFWTSGNFTACRVQHLPSTLIVEGSTHKARFKLQRRLLKEIWQKWQKTQDSDRQE